MCPALDRDSDSLTTVHNLRVAPNLRHLYQHLLGNRYIRELTAIDNADLGIFSHAVLDKIRAGDPQWETMVPEKVARIIKDKGLFNWRT